MLRTISTSADRREFFFDISLASLCPISTAYLDRGSGILTSNNRLPIVSITSRENCFARIWRPKIGRLKPPNSAVGCNFFGSRERNQNIPPQINAGASELDTKAEEPTR